MTGKNRVVFHVTTNVQIISKYFVSNLLTLFDLYVVISGTFNIMRYI